MLCFLESTSKLYALFSARLNVSVFKWITTDNQGNVKLPFLFPSNFRTHHRQYYSVIKFDQNKPWIVSSVLTTSFTLRNCIFSLYCITTVGQTISQTTKISDRLGCIDHSAILPLRTYCEKWLFDFHIETERSLISLTSAWLGWRNQIFTTVR